MEQRTIKFKCSGSSTTFGNFGAGDVLRCSAEQAKHFVEDAMCADYADAAAVKTASPVPAVKQPATRKRKA